MVFRGKCLAPEQTLVAMTRIESRDRVDCHQWLNVAKQEHFWTCLGRDGCNVSTWRLTPAVTRLKTINGAWTWTDLFAATRLTSFS